MGLKNPLQLFFPVFHTSLYLKKQKNTNIDTIKNTFKNHFNYISFPRKEMSGNFCFNSEKNGKYHAFSALI